MGNGSGSFAFTNSNAINDGGTLALWATPAGWTLQNTISGVGGVTVLGSSTGSVTLAPAALVNNSYLGGTTVDAGKLIAGNAFGLTSGTVVNVSGGGVQIDGNQTSDGIFGAWTSYINLFYPTCTLTVKTTTGSPDTFAGVISGSGSLLVTGSGVLTLTGANTYGGGTTINSGATLQLGSSGGNGSVCGPITDSGGLALYAATALVVPNTITGGGSITINPTNGSGGNPNGTVILSATNNYVSGLTTITAGTLQVGGSLPGEILDNGFLAVYPSGGLLTLGAISGSGGVAIDGTGTATFSAANGYSGSTAINGTTLVANVSQALPNGTVLSLNGAGSALLINANQTIGTLAGSSGSGITLNGGCQLTVNTTSGGSSTFAGVINGSGTLALGTVGNSNAGTLTLSGQNIYTGGTNIYAGTLGINADAALGDESGPLVFGGSGGTLQADANGIALNPLRTVTIDCGTTATIETQSYSMSIDSPISSISGGGNLQIDGSNCETSSLTVDGQIGGSLNVADGATWRPATSRPASCKRAG